MDQINKLKEKISELEAELALKEAELMKYKLQVGRANEKLERMIQDMNQEMRLALTLQRSLSPTEMPQISGMEMSSKFVPGARSGGDYFDVFELEDRMKFGVLVSSCSGYGVSALMISALIKFSAMMEARKGFAPHEVIAKFAEEVIPHIKNKDAASLFYAIVDRRSFELKYCAVGQFGAFIQRHNGTLESLKSMAGPLCHGFSQGLRSESVSLEAKDRVILATDGLFGLTNGTGDLFGKHILPQAVAGIQTKNVHEVRNEILFQAEQFSGSQIPDRDQTVVVIEMKDSVMKLAK